MNSIRYMQAHNPHAGTPNDEINRSLCWRARFCKRRWRRLAARNELILRNQGLITTQARAVRKVSRLPLDDLISEGQFGLIMAIRLFDFGRGTAFSTYATACIHRYLCRQSWIQGHEIRLPGHLQVAEKKRRGKLHEAAKRARRLKSLATPTAMNRVLADELLDREPGPTSQDKADDQMVLGRLMRLLTSREREVVEIRYGLGDSEPQTLRGAGQLLNVTYERVRQIETRAIAMMAEGARKEMSA